MTVLLEIVVHNFVALNQFQFFSSFCIVFAKWQIEQSGEIVQHLKLYTLMHKEECMGSCIKCVSHLILQIWVQM